MTTTLQSLAHAAPELRDALGELLLSMADDELVIGMSDSEWTGIAPMLEEDVAISSLAQDELGHAKALYELLAALRDDGGDADAIAYDRTPDAYRHCRLLDHPRGDWAQTIARRWLYDTADAVRLDALGATTFEPLRELVGKIRREERYHLLHVAAWLERLARHPGEPRRRLEAALSLLAPDAGTVFTPLAGEATLVEAGVLAAPMQALHDRWRANAVARLRELELDVAPGAPAADGRRAHSEAFLSLHEAATSVRRLDPDAAW